MKCRYSYFDLEVRLIAPPRFFGIAYHDPCGGHILYLPIPLNIIYGKLMAVWIWLKFRHFSQFERRFLGRLHKAYNDGYDAGLKAYSGKLWTNLTHQEQADLIIRIHKLTARTDRGVQ